MGEETAEVNGASKRRVSERITNWGVSDSIVDKVLDLLVAFVVLCLLMTSCLFTLTVRYHIITILMLPLLTYFILGSAGFRLRMKERRSRLIYTDIVAAVHIIALSLYMDRVYSVADPNYLVQIIIALVGVCVLSEYLCRRKMMFHLFVPMIMVVDAACLYLCGVGVIGVFAITLLVPIPFAYCMTGYSYYFGYGRVVINGKYEARTERQAVAIREKQAEQRKREREAFKQESGKQKKASR